MSSLIGYSDCYSTELNEAIKCYEATLNAKMLEKKKHN